MGWVYFFFGFTSAITVYSIVNSVVMYKAQKLKMEARAKDKSDEEEFQNILAQAFGIDNKKEKAGKIIKLVKDEDDDDDPTLH